MIKQPRDPSLYACLWPPLVAATFVFLMPVCAAAQNVGADAAPSPALQNPKAS
jgi:hypothetical protein